MSDDAGKDLSEPERLFAFNRTVAETFRQNARSSTAKILARANAQIADMLDEFAAVLRNMATIPTGAGRA